MSNSCFFCYSIAIAITKPNVAHAESLPAEIALPSVFSVEIGGDVEGSHNLYLDLDTALESGARILASYSANRTENNDTPVTTRSIVVGFRTDPMALFSGGLDIEQWGDNDTLLIDTLRLALEFNTEQWSFSLRPQWRTLTLTTDCIAIISARCDTHVKVKSTGSAVDVSYYSNGPWSFSMGYSTQRYDKKVAALASDTRLQFVFSAATLDLATGLEDRRSHVGVSYFLHDSLWSITAIKSVSKVTGDASNITVLRYSTDLNKQWRIRINLGTQSFDNETKKAGFAGTGLSYNW